jgi:addiction module HigA family antidote
MIVSIRHKGLKRLWTKDDGRNILMLKRGMKPAHPGEVLRTIYMDPLGISQSEAAENLGVTRKTLSMLLNGHQGISAEMALRLSKAFNTTPDLWMNMQVNYDLWFAGQNVKLAKIKVFRRSNLKNSRTTPFQKIQPGLPSAGA